MTQTREELSRCQSCEAGHYADVFNLTSDDVSVLTEHMTLYSTLRQCCGYQMSKYEVLRLNGCDVSRYQNLSDYPRCEQYNNNFTAIENRFISSGIPYSTLSYPYDWSAPGDCAASRASVASGRGFNNWTVHDCQFRHGTVAGRPPTAMDILTEERRNSVLQAPFVLVQLGSPGGGDGWQWHLLRALAVMKTPRPAKVTVRSVKRWGRGTTEMLLQELEKEREWGNKTSVDSLVVKTLKAHVRLKLSHWKGNVTVFASGEKMPGWAMYSQSLADLNSCPSCEVKKYKAWFNLTDAEVDKVTWYMSYYSLLRRCCSPYMPYYEVLRRNGCDVSKYKTLPDYPHCEDYDLTQVEREFMEIGISYEPIPEGMDWKRVGDCTNRRLGRRRFMTEFQRVCPYDVVEEVIEEEGEDEEEGDDEEEGYSEEEADSKEEGDSKEKEGDEKDTENEEERDNGQEEENGIEEVEEEEEWANEGNEKEEESDDKQEDNGEMTEKENSIKSLEDEEKDEENDIEEENKEEEENDIEELKEVVEMEEGDDNENEEEERVNE
mmetsp:Transcript_32112/g.39398  ORF Transcript_32112/g.39398 Transcript_32112/m.39398 type:complete len:548 (+) Transcript_32112:418-2061(+)